MVIFDLINTQLLEKELLVFLTLIKQHTAVILPYISKFKMIA